MARYLDPKNDLTFKRIFGEHPDLLISFLNALMPLSPGQLIQSVKYLAAEQVPANPAKKNSIVDVHCEDNFNRQFIVEMQMFWSNAFSNRMVFNASKAYVRQLERGEDFELLQPVYGLGIINDIFDRATPEFYHHYQTINCKNNNEVIKGLEFVMVELPKFKPESWSDRKMAVLWLRFLKEITEHTRIVSEDLADDANIRQALALCEEGAFTPEELATYEKYWDFISTEKALITRSNTEGRAEGRAEGLSEGLAKGEKKGMAKGLAKGLAKGRAEGKAEGLAEGEKKGKAEGKAEGLAEVAINCHRNGYSLEQIQVFTGLSKEKIQEIIMRYEL